MALLKSKYFNSTNNMGAQLSTYKVNFYVFIDLELYISSKNKIDVCNNF